MNFASKQRIFHTMSTSIDIEGKLRGYFAGQDDVSLAYLFGSHAANRPGPLSDVDVGVVLDDGFPPSEFLVRRLELIRELQRVLGHEVDVVVLNEATPLLAHRAIAQGKVVFSSNETFRVRFETKRVAEYLDTAYLRDEYNRALEKRAIEGKLFG